MSEAQCINTKPKGIGDLTEQLKAKDVPTAEIKAIISEITVSPPEKLTIARNSDKRKAHIMDGTLVEFDGMGDDVE